MKILNIGSGPVTPGKTPNIEITHADRRDYGVEVQDMEKMTYPNKMFDLVICINALDHTPDARSALKEIIRVGRWVYIQCWLIQHMTSGKRHFWDVLEDGTFKSKDDEFNIKDFGFKVEFMDKRGERRHNYIIARRYDA
jgi:SAM-dependent methyltransferase